MVLLTAVYLGTLALVVALVVGMVWIAETNGLRLSTVMILMSGALLCWALLAGLWAGIRRVAVPDDGVPLDEDAQPALWAEVRGLAQEVRTRPPDEIRLLSDANAAVAEESRWFGLVSGRRVMFVGAPLLRTLTRQQLCAVLAHELGHYGRRHTALGTLTYRSASVLVKIVEGVGRHSLAGRLYYPVLRLHTRISRGVTQRQEIEADAFSLIVAGRDPAAAALRSLAPLNELWDRFFETYVVAGARLCQKRPEDLFGGFDRFLAHPANRALLERRMWADLPQERIHPFDTHPPLSLRIELLESSSEDGRTDDGTPASVLVEGLPDLLRRLSDLTFRGSELEPASWSQLAAEVGPRRACHLAGLLVVSSASPGLGARDLAEALRQLGRGSVRELAAALVDHNTDSSGAREAATALVAAMVESALVTHCGARHVEGWSGTWGLVDSDGQGVDAAGLVAGVIGDRHAADSLLDALVAEGVPQDFTVKPDDVSRATSAEHDLVAAAAGNAGWGRVRVLLVAADRVVVVRYGMLRLTRALLTHRHPDGYLNALHDASNRSLRDVEAMRGALAVPITEVQWVELTIRRDDVVRVHLRSRRGSVRFKTMVKTGSLGPGLAHLLGDRLRIC